MPVNATIPAAPASLVMAVSGNDGAVVPPVAESCPSDLGAIVAILRGCGACPRKCVHGHEKSDLTSFQAKPTWAQG